MKTKLIAATIALSSMFTAVSAQAASAIYNYAADGSITSLSHITGLMVDNVSYDLSFSDTWDGVYVERALARDITFAFSSALNPSNVEGGTGVNQGVNNAFIDSRNTDSVNAGTLNSTSFNRVAFDEFASLTQGCGSDGRYVTKCEMFLVSDYKDGNGSDYNYYVTNDEKLQITIDREQDDDDSRNYTNDDSFRLIQPVTILQAQILDANGGNARYRTFMSVTPTSTVPVPAAAILFAPAFLGLMGLRRKAKNLAA